MGYSAAQDLVHAVDQAEKRQKFTNLVLGGNKDILCILGSIA